MLVRMNHRELTTESKSTRLSIIRFYGRENKISDSGDQSKFEFRTTAYLITLFQQNLIIFTQRDTENNGCDVFEAMDPLLAFASLSSDIKHTVNLRQ